MSFAKVIRVIDGDTIQLEGGDRVRYIGMNTPELETNECFATEASEINKNLVLGKIIKLEKDISDTDKYGRLLRYVYVDNVFIDDYLVKNGDAKVMTIPPDTKYKDEFLQSQNYAKQNNLGLWGKCN
jgi:micrococcal nuclease